MGGKYMTYLHFCNIFKSGKYKMDYLGPCKTLFFPKYFLFSHLNFSGFCFLYIFLNQTFKPKGSSSSSSSSSRSEAFRFLFVYDMTIVFLERNCKMQMNWDSEQFYRLFVCFFYNTIIFIIAFICQYISLPYNDFWFWEPRKCEMGPLVIGSII